MDKLSKYGKWFVFAGAVCWSMNAPFITYISLDPLLVCGLRSLIAGIVMLPFIRIKKLNWNMWMVLYLVSYIGICTCVVVALKTIPATIAIGMQYTGMIWLFVIGLIFKTTKLNWRTLTPVILVIFGVVLFMSSGVGGESSASSFGMFLAILESFFFAGMTGSSKKAAGDNPLGLTSVANLATAIFIFTFLSPSISDLTTINVQNWLIMLFLGIVQLGLGYSFFNIGLHYVQPQKASMLALWEMILGPLWVAIFLHKYPSFIVLCGFVVILLGMILDTALSAKKEPEFSLHEISEKQCEIKA